MSTENSLYYEFGDFLLEPNTQILYRGKDLVPIRASELAMLTAFVLNPGKVLTATELISHISRDADNRHLRNASYHVARLRKILGDDAIAPRYIKTIHGINSYRFIALVRVTETAPVVDVQDEPRNTQEIAITTHLLVPMFFGPTLFNNPSGTSKKLCGIECKVFEFESSGMYVFPTGFGVWRNTVTEPFKTFSDFSKWRHDVYKTILAGKHVLTIRTRAFLRGIDTDNPLSPLLGKPGYVFSLNIAERLPFRNRDTTRNALQILACPSTLNVGGKSHEIENILLETGIPVKDLLQFGVGDVGFASWDSVSYLRPFNGGVEPKLLHFEIALQSLWWTAKCASEIMLARDHEKIPTVRKMIPAIRQQFSRLKNIEANETPSERTMIEALLTSSRIELIVSEVIELAKELNE
ncbi:MAG: winged helix-turn-helix domain-containing protein [Pyrinomonadaceae bacterium]